LALYGFRFEINIKHKETPEFNLAGLKEAFCITAISDDVESCAKYLGSDV